jgi:L,D-peptidoglycan transpeptidase YkuD (ErfK/YbiS/YcfS/YnhG family)
MKLILAMVCCLGCLAALGQKPLGNSRQVLVVTAADWKAVDATMQRYERRDAHSKWVSVGAPVAVVVGKNGLGWDAGFAAAAGKEEPVKKEGDGKAPAGVFPLLTSFGYASQALPQSKMPYLSLTNSVECVDDVKSKYYNRVLDRASVTPDWNSSEKMHRADELYEWGLVVGSNSAPVRAGDGSCIFLHIWRGAGVGTVGCTAMPVAVMQSLLGWLDTEKKPLLVQLPTREYARLQKRWRLPNLAE